MKGLKQLIEGLTAPIIPDYVPEHMIGPWLVVQSGLLGMTLPKAPFAFSKGVLGWSGRRGWIYRSCLAMTLNKIQVTGKRERLFLLGTVDLERWSGDHTEVRQNLITHFEAVLEVCEVKRSAAASEFAF